MPLGSYHDDDTYITHSPHSEGLAPPLTGPQHTEASSGLGVEYPALHLAGSHRVLSIEVFWCGRKQRKTLGGGRVGWSDH